MSLSSVIFPTDLYVVTRTNQGAYVDGDYVPGSTEEITITAGIQPVSGDMLRNLREGQISDDVRVVYTAVELVALDETAGIVADTLVHDGDVWRVFKVERFRILANRWRAHIERIGAAPVET